MSMGVGPIKEGARLGLRGVPSHNLPLRLKGYADVPFTGVPRTVPRESWPHESGQIVKWIYRLTAASMIAANQETR